MHNMLKQILEPINTVNLPVQGTKEYTDYLSYLKDEIMRYRHHCEYLWDGIDVDDILASDNLEAVYIG